MKKNLLLLFAALLALGVSAQVKQAHDQFAKATVLRSGAMVTNSLASDKAQPARARANADDEIDTLYYRPLGTYLWAADPTTNRGFRGILAPANTNITWRNASNAPEGTIYSWYTVDHSAGEWSYPLRSNEKDFVEYERPSLLRNYFQVGTSTYWMQWNSSNPPILTLNNSENGYEYPGVIQYGATPRVMTDTTLAVFQNYSVTSYNQFSDEYTSFTAGYFYWANQGWTHGANDPNSMWLTRIKKAYPNDSANISNAVVTAVMQKLDKPNAPYILNQVNWAVGYFSSNAVPLTLKIYAIDEETNTIGQVIAESTLSLPEKTYTPNGDFIYTLNFPFSTVDDEGGEQDGIVIKDAVMLELSGFADAYADGTFTIFATPVVGQYSEKALAEQRFDAYAKATYQLGTGTREYIPRVTFGYYMDNDEVNDSIYYITNYRYTLDLEMPWLTPDTNLVEIPVGGGNVVLPISAYKSSDEWEITLEDGSDLPEWLVLDYADEMYRDLVYNQYSELTFGAGALPEGVKGREAKVLLSYRGCAEALVTVKQGEVGGPTYKTGDVNGDGEVDVNDVNILINIVLGTDSADKYEGRANVDGVGDVDVADVNALINLVLGK